MEKKNKPVIRFKGFDDNWEDDGFENIFLNISNNSLSRDNLNYDSGRAKNVHYGDILVKFNEVLDVKKETIPYVTNDAIVEKLKNNFLRDGDIIISDAAEDETVGKCVEVLNITDENILSGLHTIAVRPKQKFAPGYLGYYLNSNPYHDQLLKLMQGTKVLSISKTAIKNTSIRFPSEFPEQQKIGNFFENLGQLITQHQQKYSKLKTLKKAMLDRMFPKQGQLVPEIRFKGFEGDWEEKKFEQNIVSIQTGTNLLGMSTNNGMPLLKMGNIQRGFFSFDKLEYLAENINVENENIANYGDFLFNTRNTLELVGKGATWTGASGKYAFNSNIARFKFDGINTIFFNYLYNTQNLIKQVQARAMGTTSVAAIYPKNLNSMKYRLPSNEEQNKIGNYFKNLDELIANHELQITKLQNIKKVFLAKMFI